MKKTKKSVKPSANNNKKEAATKSKQALNKSVERRKKGGLNLTTESNKNSTIEARNVRDKINVIKPTKKDGDEKKSSSVSNRTNKTAKTKDYNNDEGQEKGGDFLYKAMYKTNIDNKGYSIENMSTPDSQKVQKNNDISKSKENPISQPAGSQFAISMERTDDIIYDIGDKKIHSNINKSYKYDYKSSNDRKDSDDSTQKKYYETQNKKTNYNSGSNYERPSTSTYSSRIPDNFVDERTVDLYVIDTDDGEEPIISSKYKKRIDRTRNKIKEIQIEKYDSKTPIRDEKLTGFVLIRKNKGKKIYDVEFEDNIDKINEILRNKKVMIKNEIIQFTTLTKLSNYDRDIKTYTDKISRLQNDLNKKDYSKPRDNDNKNNDYEKQISELKSKNLELNKIIFQQQDELDENIREFKQVKLAYDQLKDSIEREKIEREKMEKEKEKEKEREQQIKEEPSKIKKKAAQMQLDENNDQKAIKEMKLRIKKYKDVLKNPDEKNKMPFTYRQDDPNAKVNQSPTKKRHKAAIENAQNKDNQPQGTEPSQNPDEDEDDDIGEYVLGDEDAKDPKKRKMKNAVNRFRKKYHEVIKEEKKIQKEKEKEEKEREENEERELEDENYQEEKEREERERQEKERREREEKERKEREEFERRERERKEREEKERKEREERERKERERKERERKEREERERKERERKEREKRDREEKERKERERKEREERERKEREKKDNKPAMGGARAGGKMGVNFSKMLAEKLKMAPPGASKKGAGAPKVDSKPPIMDKNVDMVKLLEDQPFQGRKDKKKPTRKVFVIEDDNED